MTSSAAIVTGQEAEAGAILVHFPTARAANLPVAGIPAAARVIRVLGAPAAGKKIMIAVPGGWQPSALCRAEWEKVTRVNPLAADDTDTAGNGRDAVALLECFYGQAETLPEAEGGASIARLRNLHRAIIKASAKPEDGIVSRHMNRPVSQAISSVILRLFPSVLPLYATVAVAICAAAMVVALVTGGPTGALIGAILFQAASVLDGVDGEIARASHRSSRNGATLDSVTDALTNLGFIIGLSINSYKSGDQLPAVAGAVGVLALAIGLIVLGALAYRRDGRVHFDMVKTRFAQSPGRVRQVLAKVFMRDLYALVFALAVIFGLANWVLWLIAVAAVGWLVTVGTVQFRSDPEPVPETSIEPIIKPDCEPNDIGREAAVLEGNGLHDRLSTGEASPRGQSLALD